MKAKRKGPWFVLENIPGRGLTPVDSRYGAPIPAEVVRLLNAGERAKAEVKRLRALIHRMCCVSCGAEIGETHGRHCQISDGVLR